MDVHGFIADTHVFLYILINLRGPPADACRCMPSQVSRNIINPTQTCRPTYLRQTTLLL